MLYILCLMFCPRRMSYDIVGNKNLSKDVSLLHVLFSEVKYLAYKYHTVL